VKFDDFRNGPVLPIFYDGVRFLLRGGMNMSASILFDGVGYRVMVFNSRQSGVSLLHSERSKKPRVFRSVDTAAKVCRELGFSNVTLYLD
jgi:hypothetical protein